MSRKKLLILASTVQLFLLTFSLSGQRVYIPPDKPRLIVQIIVEQLRFDQIEKMKNRFSDKGLRMMINEGTCFNNAFFNYIHTQSAPGHATIATGAEPSAHGITSDYWQVPLKNEIIYCTADKGVNPVGGSYESGLHSPVNLMASTFSDELFLATKGKAKIYSVGLKESSAILSAGHTANGVFWFDSNTGTWMSSSYYMKDLPAWVNDFNAMRIADSYLEKIWQPLKKIEEYSDCSPDSNKYEAGFNGISWFPYDLKKMHSKGVSGIKKDYSLLADTPFGNSYTKDFALKLIKEEGLGNDNITDFISICFSATDNIGHRFGPSSVEAADALLRLDADIAEILGFLLEKIEKKNVLICFTASHGVSETPALLEANRIPAGYFIHTQALQLLRIYLNAIYGQGDWIKGYFDNQVYLNRILIEDARISLEEIQKRVARFMVQNSGVAAAYPLSIFETADFVNGRLHMADNNFVPQRSGDVLIILNPGWVEASEYAVTGHKSPYNYDTHVPLIWYGWTVNRATVNRRVNMTDIAPTLSVMCGIPVPNTCTGEPANELLR
ncbi:MAG TPA: alkaline phosphatase family protein [Bacteroidales bacterium]|nr:alkaline phosphatase family protein [Bacteroidales bacterium]HCI54294.1 alkaline phosphatase [Bacteroidales bacterium]HOU96725.1 alkaline phosphatase family protein [Bacteroidales bacterium]HQG35848.1 alkaline phosphatase family protein [Bacteroidales bacterium]HQG52358.1 alkaline phosphatase family protein [Bacteroidales bacterium]